jgi:hypothetical protein
MNSNAETTAYRTNSPPMKEISIPKPWKIRHPHLLAVGEWAAGLLFLGLIGGGIWLLIGGIYYLGCSECYLAHISTSGGDGSKIFMWMVGALSLIVVAAIVLVPYKFGKGSFDCE